MLPFWLERVLINAVVSMGRRNTQLEPNLQWKQRLKSLARVRSAGTLLRLGFDQVQRKQMGSSGEALSNQRTGWCCIDRLNRQRLPDKCHNAGVNSTTRRSESRIHTG